MGVKAIIGLISIEGEVQKTSKIYKAAWYCNFLSQVSRCKRDAGVKEMLYCNTIEESHKELQKEYMFYREGIFDKSFDMLMKQKLFVKNESEISL